MTHKDIKRGMNPDDIKKILDEMTIFDKIELSGFTKEHIMLKILDLEVRQVPQRNVLLDMSDEEVTEYWFKNWLHPLLKHVVPKSPRDKIGCSRKVLERDFAVDNLHFYENGQQNFTYTLDDIKEWIGVE